MRKIKIGLLPLYIELYDRIAANCRPRMNEFPPVICRALERRGLEVVCAPVCRLRREFDAAIRRLERENVEALVTLHLAYSPSLESAPALARTRLPIVVLDTTPTYAYGPDQDPDELMFNHGIHGVQDMCNLLLRNGKPFKIAAGHWQKSDVLERVVLLAQSARMATAMRAARVGLIGRPFKGMGDFAVSADVLKRTIGIETVSHRATGLKRLINAVSDKDLAAEIAGYRRQFKLGAGWPASGGMSVAACRRTARVGLGIRRWIEQEQLTAFTFNFLDINRTSGLPTVPFLAASQAMARGIGYAGEGDVLTAALIGALAAAGPDTSFTEMFCPDWKGNRIFLSHMGEINPRTVAGRARLCEMDYKFSDAANPLRAVGCFRGGPAVFVNLAPLAGRRYRLIVAPVAMEKIKGVDRMADSVHGWFRSSLPAAEFLEAYSRAGGTHHAALVYGTALSMIAGFGDFMGWETVVIGCDSIERGN